MQQVVHNEYRTALHDHWWFRARRTIFARLLDALVPLPNHARILEIGPGHGVNLPVLRERGTVTTLDVDRGSLAGSVKEGARLGVCADGLQPPFREQSFALVCAFDVLEHLADDAAALRACHALLAPGGTLMLTVPALAILWGRQDVLSGHYRRYRRSEVAARVRAAGFSITKLTFCNTLLFPAILAVRLAMRPFLRRSVRGGSDFSVRPPGLIERALYRLFACEAGWLVKRTLPVGVSLLCIARKGPA